MKFGTPVSGKIENLDPKGAGVFEKDGRTFAVRFSVPGDEIDGTVSRRRKGIHFLDAKITKPSNDRVQPRCKFAGTCGGCAWQQIDYTAQITFKHDLVSKALSPILDIEIPKPAHSPDLFFYRNRMDYVFGRDGELGLKEPEKWWSVLDLTECFLLSLETPRILNEIRVWANKHNLTFWNQKTEAGLLRYVMIREGKNTGERLVNIITSAEKFSDDVKEDLVKKLSSLATSIVHGTNPTLTDISLAQSFDVLHGNLTFTEKLNNYIFEIHPNSFFQTNSRGTERLITIIRELLKDSDGKLLDLYCGVGTLGISLADLFDVVEGVEIDEIAVDLAKKNAELNNITNSTFRAAKVEDLVTHPGKQLTELLSNADTVIVDPPRSGLHPRVLESLSKNPRPRLLYISCNYQALARELPKLLEVYAPKEVRLIDLFPHTPHVETVVLFESHGRN